MSTFIYPLVGGLLIGLSATIMLGGLGRITGISGILGSSIEAPKTENIWRYTFILGLITGGLILKMTTPELFNYQIETNIWKVIIAGLLVGYGTRLGSGCTSGHGVCGLPRFSKRSIIATVTFMGFGIITVAVMGVLKW